MPISGLVLHLDPHAEPDALRDVGFGELFITGERKGAKLPAVIDAPDYPAHDAVLAELRARADVVFVDLVFHDFSDVEDFGDRPRRFPRRSSR